MLTDTEFSWTFAQTIELDKEWWIQYDRVTVHAPVRAVGIVVIAIGFYLVRRTTIIYN